MNTVLIVLFSAAAIFALERLRPAARLPWVAHWYPRAIAFNAVQAVVACYGAALWDKWLAQVQLISIAEQAPALQVFLGYLLITFVYYWWHRARHRLPLLWRYLHQLHHSPARIEVITSFYKHPAEIIANALLSSAILHTLLGLDAAAAGLCVLLTGLAELVYHMNVKTPWLLGLFFQRPEMHRVHHQRGLHHYNYSDLPLWDMLFGTWRNPVDFRSETGFPDNLETRLWSLLRGEEMKS